MEFLTDPGGWWVEPFTSNVFMRRALYASLLLVLTTSLVGTWVVLRGMSFLGDALAHGVLPGIALAFIVGVHPTIGAFVAAFAMVLGISLIRSHSPLQEDASIGIFFVGFLALAVVIMSTSSGAYAGDLTRFLFGSITGVDADDLRRQAIAAFASVAGVILSYRAFLVMTFDQAQAQVLGLRPRLAHGALLVLLAISIIASFEAVGNLLVFAFLVAPPATAVLLVRRVPVIMVAAVAIGVVSTVTGLLISYHYSSAAGATMALATVVVFLAILTGKAALSALGVSRIRRAVAELAAAG